MKNVLTYFSCLVLVGGCGWLLLSCDTWELPTHKSQRNCVKPSGNLDAQIQQRKVDFSISSSSGTIDKVIWDFGNGSTTTTTGMTVSYTYPASTTYTAKATLTNSCGIETTIQRTISVSDAVLPTVSLQAITTVSTNSAMAGMTVTSTGNATITQYGICYSSVNATPTKENDSVIPITGSPVLNTSIPFSLTALQPNTLYYVRSFAVNSAGPGYSSPAQTFRTGQNPVVTTNGSSNVGTAAATVNFVLTNSGNPVAIEYGICYSSSVTTPDVTNSSVAIVTSPAVGVNVGVNLSNLTPNKTYYYRSYAKSSSGEVVYGAVMSFTTQADTVAQDLIASVSFTDKSLLDVSGYNNHVKTVGTTFTTDHTGRANSAILLNGNGDYFYMDDNSGILNPDELTISLWIKPVAMLVATKLGETPNRMQIYNKSSFDNGLPQTYSSLMKLENDKGPRLAFLTNIKQNSNCVGGEGWQDLEFPAPVELNTWYHLVFTYSGKTAKMYFNNVLVLNNQNLPANKIDKCPGGELKFGAQYRDLPWYFNGAMDDIRIYKRALTPAEVETLSKQ